MAWKVGATGLIAATACLSLSPEDDSRPGVPPPRDDDSPGCAGGCAAVRTDAGTIPDARIRQLLAGLSARPKGAECPELDELLFHWREAAPFVEAHADEAPPLWRALLARELARRDVRVRARIVDAGGSLRVAIDHVVRFGVKNYMEPETLVDLQPPEISAVVQRVAPDRFWVRF